MDSKKIIESIGLSAAELKGYLLSEVDEFLAAESDAEMDAEFADVLFALKAMAWAHGRRHFETAGEPFAAKLAARLREFATLSRRAPRFSHDRIPEMSFGVFHLAFGQFNGPWSEFDPLRNGTVAEIHLLTEVDYLRAGARTNHCIVTFDDCEGLEYSIIEGAPDIRAGNVVLCRIPDFLFRRAKGELCFDALALPMALQFLAAMAPLASEPAAIAHLYSWECGFLFRPSESRDWLRGKRSFFSPGLTVGRLSRTVGDDDSPAWTLTRREREVAAEYEAEAAKGADVTVVESSADLSFFSGIPGRGRVEGRSFSAVRSSEFPSMEGARRSLILLAGGRPVKEKGFEELCAEAALLKDWALTSNIHLELRILCSDGRSVKRAAYLESLLKLVEASGVGGVVRFMPRVSVPQLKGSIRQSDAVVVPSIFDPFCLMATYAVEAGRPAFVSRHAGVSENVRSQEFVFDPLVRGELTRAITHWVTHRPVFRYEASFAGYEDLYLETGGSR